MAGNPEKISQEKSLLDYIPKQVPQEYIKIDAWKTIGHIAYGFKIEPKWLQETLMDFSNNGTISTKDFSKPGTIHDTYFWWEPRLGDEFMLIKWDGKDQLYRKRWNAVIFMTVPEESMNPVKKWLKTLAASITQEESPTQKALFNLIQTNPGISNLKGTYK